MNQLLDKDQVAAMLTISITTLDRRRKSDLQFPKPAMTFDYKEGDRILRWNSDDIARYAGRPSSRPSPFEIANDQFEQIRADLIEATREASATIGEALALIAAAIKGAKS